MDEHIQLLRQRLQELRDEVRAINEDREFLKRANRTLANMLDDERSNNEMLREIISNTRTRQHIGDRYWAEAVLAGKQDEWA